MKTNGKNTMGPIYVTVCTLTTVLCVIFCTFLYSKNADLVNIDGIYETVLFRQNAPTVIFTVFIIVACLFFVSSAFFFRKKKIGTEEGAIKISMIFARSGAGLFLIATVLMYFRLNTENTPYANSKLQWISLALAPVASLYFLLNMFSSKLPAGVRLFTGICTVGWLLCQALSVHFFMLDFLNSPTRISALLAVCSLIFFFLSELKLQLPERAQPGIFVASGMIAFFLCTTEGLTKMILSFTGKAGFTVDINTYFTLCRLAMGIYAFLAVLPALLKKDPTGTTDIKKQLFKKEPEESTEGQPEEAIPESSSDSQAEEPAKESVRDTEREDISTETAVSDGESEP